MMAPASCTTASVMTAAPILCSPRAPTQPTARTAAPASSPTRGWPWPATRQPLPLGGGCLVLGSSGPRLEPLEQRSFTYVIPEGADGLPVSISLYYRNLPPYFLRDLGLDDLVERLEIFTLGSTHLVLEEND